jgi:hypothetical protein
VIVPLKRERPPKWPPGTYVSLIVAPVAPVALVARNAAELEFLR